VITSTLEGGKEPLASMKDRISSLDEQVTSPQKGICCMEMVQFLKPYEGVVIKIMF
jgi:hypothetical protein